MALGQWGDSPNNPYAGIPSNDPFAGGGSPSGGVGVHIDPKTGKIDPNYHPPANSGGSGAGAPLGSSGAAPPTVPPTVPPVNAGILGTSLKWGDIINAALAIFGMHETQKPPKIYPVPPSPSEQYRLDKTKGLYDFASNYTEQYLKGLGNVNPDFHMPNSLTGNPEFMGGVKAPVIDFGKMPSMSGAAASGSGPNPAASIPPGVTPERVRVDPSTGKWIIDGATPEEQAWLDAANQSRTAVPSAGGSNSYAP